MLMLSVAVPVLERSELLDGPVAESAHDPGECPRSHDHRICTQVGANLSAPSERPQPKSAVEFVLNKLRIEAPSVASAGFDDGHRSRAPPLA